MRSTIGREFKFDAAHFLPEHKGQCRNLHGHTYTGIVELSGEVDEKTGMLVDFFELKKAIEYILEEVDHKCLNDIYAQTTVEYLSHTFCGVVAQAFPKCDVMVQIQEGTGGYARASMFVLGGKLHDKC